MSEYFRHFSWNKSGISFFSFFFLLALILLDKISADDILKYLFFTEIKIRHYISYRDNLHGMSNPIV